MGKPPRIPAALRPSEASRKVVQQYYDEVDRTNRNWWNNVADLLDRWFVTRYACLLASLLILAFVVLSATDLSIPTVAVQVGGAVLSLASLTCIVHKLTDWFKRPPPVWHTVSLDEFYGMFTGQRVELNELLRKEVRKQRNGKGEEAEFYVQYAVYWRRRRKNYHYPSRLILWMRMRPYGDAVPLLRRDHAGPPKPFA